MEYVGGGSAMGTTKVCLGDSSPLDLLAACNVPCPGNTCSIDILDDVNGALVSFRVCFDGETFCRPQVYIGHADIAGSHARVTVVPGISSATHGVVIVT